MLPQLKQIIELEDLSFWQTSDSHVGTGFEFEHCDLESQRSADFASRLTALIKSAHPNILIRVKYESAISHTFDHNTSRMNAIRDLGFKANKLTMYVSLKSPFNMKNIWKKNRHTTQETEFLLAFRKSIVNFGFTIRPLTKKTIEELFNIDYDLIKTTKSIESPTESIGIIRLIKQSASEIDAHSLSNVLSQINNLEVSASFRRLSEVHSKLILEKKLKQLKSQTDVNAELQAVNTEDAIKNQFSRGTQLVEFEFLVTLKRDTQSALVKDMAQVLSELNKFGEFKIETFGLAPSYVATHPASTQHVTLLESDEALPLFLPVFLKSDTRCLVETRSLGLHREDNSLTHFDLFSPEYSCSNTLITGTSGKGKSVLTGLLTQALLRDQNINVIKVDVGGSHSKECELFGGREFKMKLGEASGINPFNVITTSATDPEKIGILSRFLTALILENGELQFSKDLRSKIEESVQSYINSSPTSPCLQGFYNFTKDFPRRTLLKRWVTGGIYESAFEVSAQKELCNTRLRYYNFSEVFEASDPEFAQAGIAAVLAQFNIDSINANGKRLVLICDETPFFIRSCFDFFKFSTANVRKYGHAVILISQLSTDFIVNGDSGIIENSPQRFLFNIDGKPSEFQERFSLSDYQLKTTEALKSIPSKFSEVYLQTSTTGKKLQIKITSEEYWLLTTSQPDKQKIEKLRFAVPELSLQEALKCLSLS